MDIFGLFAAAFLSASFFPFQSELIFIAMLAADRHADWLLLIIASSGNTLGAVLNWYLGRGITYFQNKRWFPIKKNALEKGSRWFARWGKWSLLLSWMPIIGDPITMAAGVFNMRLLPFVAIVAIAKTGRYLAIMALL